MENRALSIFRSLPALIQNTHLDIALQGWPAATAIIAVCGALVAVTSILKPVER